MTEDSKQQVFTELAFYLWRVKHDATGDWCPEIMFNGSLKALTVMRDAIKSMREEFKTQGQSTRKFLCNPPEDEDVLRYAKENEAEIEWQIWLVLRIEPNIPDDSTYDLRNKAVTIRLNDQKAQEFVQLLDKYLSPGAILQEGLMAPGNLFLALEWLGY